MPYKSIPNVICVHCGKSFTADHPNRKYCSKQCTRDAQAKHAPPVPPNPSGLCMCGCGEVTPIAPVTSRRNRTVRGEHVRYLRGHQTRGHPVIIPRVEYVEEDRGYSTPCWIWQLSKSEPGYGNAYNPKTRKKTKAHRMMYERVKGPIPEGLEIDHLCRVPSCVNPDHLEAVTHYENVMRGKSPLARYAKATHCIHGHPFNAENTAYYKDRRGRRCMTCTRLRARRVRRAKRKTSGLS